MPRINQYTREILPRGFQNINTPQGAFGGDTMSGLASGVDKVRARLDEIQTKRDKSSYLSAKASLELDLMNMSQEMSTSEIEGDVMEAYQQAYQNRVAEFEENVPDSMKDQWRVDNSQLYKGFSTLGLQDQVKREGQRRELEWNNAVQNYTEVVKNNPAAKDSAMITLKNMMDSYDLSPEQKALQLDKVSDSLDKVKKASERSAFVASIENDPFSFLEDAEANPDKYKKEDIDLAKKTAANFVEQAEQDALIEDISKSQEFAMRLGRGELTMADVVAEEAVNGETSLTKKARKLLSEKRPKRTPLEKATAYNDLEERRLVIEKNIEENGVTSETLGELRRLSEDAMGYAVDGYITEQAQITRFTRNSDMLLSAVKANKGSKEFWKFDGYDNPYSYGFKEVNKFMEENGIENDVLTKTEILKNFELNLGDYKSEGRKKDKAKLREALHQAKADYFISLNPNYSSPEDIPAVMIINGHEIKTGFNGGAAKSNVVNRNTVQEMTDANGNRALVEYDADGNFVRVVKELN